MRLTELLTCMYVIELVQRKYSILSSRILFCNKLLGTITPVTCHPMIFWRYFWHF